MINRVILVGRLTKDADLRYTTTGTAVGSFTVAVNRQFTNQAGEREADFINCVAWRKTAETLANFTRKGSLIGVEGRIQTRHYEKDGNRVYVTEVVVDTFSLLESKATNQERQANSPTPQASGRPPEGNQSRPAASGSNQSYQNQSQGRDPFENSSTPINISDDDLPF